jgi:hypothetical protein
MRLLVALLLASFAWGQVQVTYIPEDTKVTRKTAGKKIGLHLWNVIMSNRGAVPVNFTDRDIRMAIPDLGPIPAPRAKLILKQSERKKPLRIFADGLGWGSVGYSSGVATGLVKMAHSKELAVAAGALSLVLHFVAPKAKERADDEAFNSSWLLEGDIYLRSMETVEGAIFTGPLPPEKLKYRVVTLSLHVHGQSSTATQRPSYDQSLWRTTLINEWLALKLARF